MITSKFNIDDDEWTLNSLDDNEKLEFVLDCGLPGCLCIGYHLRAECYTAEMMQAYEDEMNEEDES